MLSPEQVQLNDIVVDPDLQLQRVVAIRMPKDRFGVHKFTVVPWKGMDRQGRIILEDDEHSLIFYGEVDVVGNAGSAANTDVPPIIHDVTDEEVTARCVEKLREIVGA